MTTIRETLIEKLVVSLHLNVPERQLLGSDSLSVEEVDAAVKRLIERIGVFPPHARIWKPGKSVFEGFFLVKRPERKIEMVWQRSKPIKPTELAERGSTDFEDLDQAILRFIERERSNGIDGVRVTPRSQP